MALPATLERELRTSARREFRSHDRSYLERCFGWLGGSTFEKLERNKEWA